MGRERYQSRNEWKRLMDGVRERPTTGWWWVSGYRPVRDLADPRLPVRPRFSELVAARLMAVTLTEFQPWE